MFASFADVWSPVAIASTVVPGKALRLVVADTPVVLFRDDAGKLAALVDRCPHRGVALSLGQVRDGCVVCPFHGWEIEGSGAVRHVPWNPDAKRSQLQGISLPVEETAGLVWLYTGAGPAAASPEAPPQLLASGLRLSHMAMPFKTHWTRLMENMLDWPHLPFVHAATIGRGMIARRESRMDIDWKATPTGFFSTIAIDGQPRPGSLEFRWPNQMVLTIPTPGRAFVLFNAAVPNEDGSSTLIVATARSFLKLGIFDAMFKWSNARIAREDKAVLESSWPAEVPHPSQELSVRTDGVVLHFRKRYFSELRSGPPNVEPAMLVRGNRRPAA